MPKKNTTKQTTETTELEHSEDKGQVAKAEMTTGKLRKKKFDQKLKKKPRNANFGFTTQKAYSR